MITDYRSCPNCGVVCDIEILKSLDGVLSPEEKEKQNYDSSYKYRAYYDFIHWRCPVCKEVNQD